MKEIKVNYTLEEIKAYVEESSYTSNSSYTCRTNNSDKLLTGSFILVDKHARSVSNVVTYTALTSDNYLVSTQIFETSYGATINHEYFGLATSYNFKTEVIFNTLPKSCREELIAKEWLARNPETLINKLQSVLNAPVAIIEDQDKTIARTEEMLVNAHHNMKKVPKKAFTSAWSRWDVLKKLPWFSKCIKDELLEEK